MAVINAYMDMYTKIYTYLSMAESLLNNQTITTSGSSKHTQLSCGIVLAVAVFFIYSCTRHKKYSIGCKGGESFCQESSQFILFG